MEYGLTDCEIQMLAGTLGEIGSMRGMPAPRLWPPGETARVEVIKTLAPTLRKAAAAKLAEAGCTTHEIAAITGHATLEMLQHYTREAEQKTRATAAILKLENARENGGKRRS